MKLNAFLAAGEEIYQEQPAYEIGADGSGRKCDCIGLLKGAVRRCGGKWKGGAGTNALYRSHLDAAHYVVSEAALKLGSIVFKGREPGESGYKLPEAYQQGGSKYNGDLRDYYHVGVVTGLNPLEITHMTEPTAKKDSKLGKWKYAGWLPEIGKEGGGNDPSPDPSGGGEIMTATVVAESGRMVKLRFKASTACRLYWEVPVGSIVTVENKGDEWSRVSGNDYDGFMMTKFLKFDEDVKPDPTPSEDDEIVEVRKTWLEQLYYDPGDMLKRREGVG